MARAETDRTEVKTYLPRFQKERWREDADTLDMSMSEFVRSMVQAGRRGFALAEEDAGENVITPRRKGDLDPVHPGGNDIKEGVLDAVEDGPKTFDDLTDIVMGDLEDQIADSLDSLMNDDLVVFDHRDREYLIIDE